MTPYALSLFPEEDLDLWRQIRRLVEQLPDIDLGEDEDCRPIILSCHILGRAIARLFAVKVQDGLFTGRYDHTWLVTRHGNIIDPYPVGILGGPVMIYGGNPLSPARQIYRPKSTRCILHGRSRRNSFKRSVRRVVRMLRVVNEA